MTDFWKTSLTHSSIPLPINDNVISVFGYNYNEIVEGINRELHIEKKLNLIQQWQNATWLQII